MGINELIKRFKQATEFRSAMQEVIETNPEVLVKAQRDQMLRGERNTGKKIGKYKSPYYAKKKFSQSSLAGYGYKDLKLTGDFHAAELVEARNAIVIFSSSDPKTQKIVEREGVDIFGLNKTSVAIITPFLSSKTNSIIIKRIHGM